MHKQNLKVVKTRGGLAVEPSNIYILKDSMIMIEADVDSMSDERGIPLQKKGNIYFYEITGKEKDKLTFFAGIRIDDTIVKYEISTPVITLEKPFIETVLGFSEKIENKEADALDRENLLELRILELENMVNDIIRKLEL